MMMIKRPLDQLLTTETTQRKDIKTYTFCYGTLGSHALATENFISC